MKAIEKYFAVVLFITLHKVLLTCKSDKILSLSVLLRSSLMLILFVELHKVLLIIHFASMHTCMHEWTKSC